MAYQLLSHEKYPEYDTYVGNAHRATVEFATPKFLIGPLNDFIRDKVIGDTVNKVRQDGARVLQVKVYEEPTDWWSGVQQFKLELEFYIPTGFFALTTSLVLLGIVTIVAIFATVILVQTIHDFFFGRRNGNGDGLFPALGEYLPWIIGGVVAVSALGVIGWMLKRRRE